MKWLTAILIVLVLTVCVQAELTLWGLVEDEKYEDEGSLTGRVGYVSGRVEGFIGTTWRPDYEQVLTVGGVYWAGDLVDPNNPVPWLPEILLGFIDEESVIRPYAGAEATWTFVDEDAGYFAGLVGIEVKGDPGNKASLIAEVIMPENFGTLGGLEDDWRLRLGLRYKF